MAGQRHIIKRQVIELEVREPAQARLYQDELSRIYRQRIVPLIEQCCNELGRPDHLYRIESLELHLGRLDPKNLEEDFTAKVDSALRLELARQIDEYDQTASRGDDRPATRSQLELFAFFARTGSLPWWADTSRPGLLAENLAQLLHESPEALSCLLAELTREPQARRRISNQYNDEQLATLSGLLVPAHAQTLERHVHELLEAVQSVQTATGNPSMRFRQSLWNNLLEVTGTGGEQYATPESLDQAVLKRVAAEVGNGWVSALHQAIRNGKVALDGQLAGVIAELADVSKPVTVDERLAIRLAQLRSEGGALSDLWNQLSAVLPQMSPSRQAELLALLNQLPEGKAEQAIVALVQTPEPGVALAALPAKEEVVDLHFSDAEELSVGNAGLVILWPFLENFFARLGLLDEKHHFKDLAARQRAVGLLQVVAAPDAFPPEYLLPLNKLLCGMELTEVFDFGPPLLDAEAEECTKLLEAVIIQAPILRNMSVDGFRGTFLLRPGLLTACDGMWLLHVERQTYDIVLERFPWSWEWVRLPWMEIPLRVDW